jgi:hypothetical protein
MANSTLDRPWRKIDSLNLVARKLNPLKLLLCKNFRGFSFFAIAKGFESKSRHHEDTSPLSMAILAIPHETDR